MPYRGALGFKNIAGHLSTGFIRSAGDTSGYPSGTGAQRQVLHLVCVWGCNLCMLTAQV